MEYALTTPPSGADSADQPLLECVLKTAGADGVLEFGEFVHAANPPMVESNANDTMNGQPDAGKVTAFPQVLPFFVYE